MEWSGSAAGRQSMTMSGFWDLATSVKVSGAAADQVANALRTAWNSVLPPTSLVPSSKAKVRVGFGHEHRVENATPTARSGMPHRWVVICCLVCSSKSPVAASQIGRAHV
jgi:hypothetical protein